MFLRRKRQRRQQQHNNAKNNRKRSVLMLVLYLLVVAYSCVGISSSLITTTTTTTTTNNRRSVRISSSLLSSSQRSLLRYHHRHDGYARRIRRRNFSMQLLSSNQVNPQVKGTPAVGPTYPSRNNNNYYGGRNNGDGGRNTSDEKERRHLDWVVRNTEKILGRDAPLPGMMEESKINLVASLMYAWSRRANKKESKAPHVVERLLQRLIKERDAGNKDVTNINTHLYNTVLDSWSNSQEDGSAERSEEILIRLEEMYAHGNMEVKPDENSYNAVIKAYVKNGTNNRNFAIQKVEEIINRMEQYEQQQLSQSIDDSSSSLSSSSPPSSSSSDEEEEMEALPSLSAATARPNRRSYNLLLYALANSNLRDAPIRCDRVLQKMLQRSMPMMVETAEPNNKKSDNVAEDDDDDGDGLNHIIDRSYYPDTNSFNQVIGAWARGRTKGFESRMDSVFVQLLELPKEMDILPNTNTFNAVLGGWLKSKRSNSIQQTERILKLMEDSFEIDGNDSARPDRCTINTLTKAFAKQGTADALERSLEVCHSMERKYRIQPDQISHNIVVDSWRKSGRPEAPERVMEILDRMERRFQINGKTQDMPDGYTYSSVIDCYVKYSRQDAPGKAEELLERMHDLYDNYGGEAVSASVYNSVINAWATSDSEYAITRVKELLQIMENDDEDGSSSMNGQRHQQRAAIPKPNRITYNTVMKALGKKGKGGDAEYAEEILKTLERKGAVDSTLLPDSYSYSSVISAYGHSGSAYNKAEKAIEILQRQIYACVENGNKAANPTIHCFNAALNACAYCKGSRNTTTRAFEIATKIYDLLLKYCQTPPDQTTFGTMLRACATLLPRSHPDREQMVESFFQAACENGCVGKLVVKQMKFAASPEQHARLIGRDLMERINPETELPQAWTRNVKNEKRMSPRQQQRR